VGVQASYYRSLESEAGELVAARLAELADELRLLDAPTPAIYRDRKEAMMDVSR
jgi:hypothetical protein